MTEVTDNQIEKSRSNAFEIILNSPNTKERVKYLYRHMRHNYFYCFHYTVDSSILFAKINERMDEANLHNGYPGLKKQIQDEDTLPYLLFTLQGVQIVLVPATTKGEDIYTLGIHKYDDSGMKSREGIAFENQVGHLLDRLYTISRDAIKSVDDKSNVKMIPFHM